MSGPLCAGAHSLVCQNPTSSRHLLLQFGRRRKKPDNFKFLTSSKLISCRGTATYASRSKRFGQHCARFRKLKYNAVLKLRQMWLENSKGVKEAFLQAHTDWVERTQFSFPVPAAWATQFSLTLPHPYAPPVDAQKSAHSKSKAQPTVTR